MSFRSAALAVATLLAAVASTSQAHADCRLTIEPGQDQWTIRHDPFAQDAAQRQFDVALFNQGDSPCEGRIQIDLRGEQYGLAKAGEAGRIAYALIDERGGADVTPRSGRDARRLNARPVTLGPGERSLIRFTFVPDTGDRLSAGAYVQDAFISVEDAMGASMAERPVTLSLNVASAALMGLKGQFQRSNGMARIDLGDLQSGARSLRTSLFVLSTGGYSVSVTSDNGGRLRLGSSDWYVDYVLGLDNHVMDLTSGATLTKPSRRAQADDYDLSVDIGSVAGKRAGEYTDVLTFTVAAL